MIFPVKPIILVTSVILSVASAFSQNLPTAKSLSMEMGMAWNLGNTMDAPGGPTGCDNPIPNQQLIDSIKAAGLQKLNINTGSNVLNLPSKYHGVMILRVRQGNKHYSGRVVSR